MCERLVGSYSLIWVELKQSSQEIETLLGLIGYQILDGLLLTVRGPLDHARTIVRLNALDVGLARRRNVLEYALELIERGCAGEHGRAEQHLAQNASNTPHVDAFRVLGRGEQDLGRAIPSRGHVLGERRIRARVLAVVRVLRERTRQTEVAQLDVTLLVEQYVRRLLIAVYHVRRVQVLGRLE